MGSLLLSFASWYTRFCLCPPRLESLFPSPCGSLIRKSCWPSMSDPWWFPVPLSDPQAVKPYVGFRTFTTLGVLWYYFSPVCGSPTWKEWDLILSWFFSSYHLTMASSLSLDMGVSFVGSSILLLMVVKQLVVFLVLSQEEMSACLSILQFWTRSYFFKYLYLGMLHPFSHSRVQTSAGNNVT